MSSIQSTCPHIQDVRIPNNVLVHKEECTQCFDTDESPAGLNVCLTCFNGGCAKHSARHAQVAGHAIVLNIKKVEIPKVVNDDDNDTEVEEPAKKITRLAIGVEGGLNFDDNVPQFEYHYSVTCLKCACELDKNEEKVAQSVAAVIASSAATVQENNVWMEDPPEPCPHTYELNQTEGAAHVANKAQATCQQCSINEHLWLCMTCGALGCGRQYADGSGGNGHGITHFEATGHPVVLKSGTITPEGTADMYCYGCDKAVIDEHLAKHLAHFGIDVSKQEKTAKSIEEMALDLNKNFNWNKALTEDGKEAELLYGPGHTGLANLGNSCYIASVCQMLFALPDFEKRYFAEGREHLETCRNGRPADCFHCQMSKLGVGMLSGDYSKQPSQEEVERFKAAKKALEGKEKETKDQASSDSDQQKEQDNDKAKKVVRDLQPGVTLRMLKRVVAKGHAEFSSNKQQDALEFLHHFLDQIRQQERARGFDPMSVFNFVTEERLQCQQCKCVRYATQTNSELPLPIPVEIKQKVDKDEETKLKTALLGEDTDPVLFTKCVEAWGAESSSDGWNCPQCQAKTSVTKSSRFQTYPELLLVHMRRFVFDNWVPTKLNTEVEMDVKSAVELDAFRAQGLQAGEKEMPKPAAGGAKQQPVPDAAIVDTLQTMGFGRNRCERAALAVNNSGVEAASEWLFAHMDDPSLDEPLAPAPAAPAAAGDAVPEEMVEQLMMMGFERDRCVYALKQTQNNAERAVDWLFSHADDPLPSEKPEAKAEAVVDTKPARYRLVAFITHMGRSTGMGHYIAHVQKNGRWVKFNDNKVSLEEKPPTGGAYLYLFQRIQQ